ncbi:dTDP-4-dehydrorhamnose reductase [Eubacteriales bacterium OttesenSCG-928-N14]|nr:dTDP-4-dehydrorhamnose reductase [Eubacteriales bacterium OttesenSCG-928-N14]
MKVLVTGAAGQLGYTLMRKLKEHGHIAKGVTRADFDITNLDAARETITAFAPKAVIHCAAYTAVDNAEDEHDTCLKVNVEGTGNIATICHELGAKMVYISTDYVFDGTSLYPYTEDDTPNPINVYGKSKLGGENMLRQILDQYFIVRTSLLFGVRGQNFVKSILRTSHEQSRVDVVTDQIGAPTYAEDLAEFLCQLIKSRKYGIYHATNEGYCSWANFARAVLDYEGNMAMVHEILSEEYPHIAKRPKNCRLSCEKMKKNGFKQLPPWHDGLARFMQDMQSGLL